MAEHTGRRVVAWASVSMDGCTSGLGGPPHDQWLYEHAGQEQTSAYSEGIWRGQLLDAGLLDELHLFVHPASAGSGLKLFEEGGPARHFELVSSQPFRTGVLYLVYAPDPNPPTGSYEEAKESLPQE